MARSLNAHQIPSGWQYELLDKLAERCSGHTPSKSFPEYWNGGIKWISLADSHRLDKGYVYETDKEISTEGVKNSSANVHPAGTVVISRDAGIGKSGVMAEPMAISQHFIAWKCDNEQKMNNWYLYNWLQFNKQEFERQAVGSTIKTIGLPFFKKLKIAAPPYLEQQKIAKILSTWDKAISMTERLIDNSTQQKKALMQQLLTGKKRLLDDEGKRFAGEWEEGLLGDLVDVTTGYAFKSNEFVEHKNDSYSIVRMSDLKEGVLNLTQSARVPKSTVVGLERYKLSEGDFIFGMSGSLDNYATVKNVDLPCYLNQRVGKIRAKSNSNQDFVSYIYLSDRVRESILNKAAGAAQLNISIGDLRKTSIRYPNKKEQQKIATVLINADKEIDLLEQQLADLQQEKKALMQVLLTGKVRVVVDGES